MWRTFKASRNEIVLFSEGEITADYNFFAPMSNKNPAREAASRFRVRTVQFLY